jgi:site-specific DNA-methyltransferase (adenine-specific)
MAAGARNPRFTLLQGDCLTVLEKITDLSIDMIFADPPYNLSNAQ